MAPLYELELLATNKPLLVTLELPTGEVFHGKALCTELSHEGSAAGDYGWDISIRGVGEIEFSHRDDFARRTKMATAREWCCEWCNGVNDRARKCCEHCGGHRSFLYE